MEAFPMHCILCLLFHLILSIPATSQPHNISPGSPLTATKGNSTCWLSPSGDFAFGFQEVQNNGFLLAIWFDKVPDKTIVWSANRNTLVRSGSTAQVTTPAGLVLKDPSGNQIWAASLVGAGVSYAAMLDTGNFVLSGGDAVKLWQSFDHPTDTILPTQTLNQDGTLIARYTNTTYSHGRFKFMLQTDGNLVMYTTDYPFTNNNIAYWPQVSIGSGYQVFFNRSGYIFLVSQNGSILNYVTSSPVSADRFYQRAIIDYDGVFRQYVYPKTGSSSAAWPMSWSTLKSIPLDICRNISGSTGSGACGFNSYCTINDSKPSCLCPPGYHFLDPLDERLGCTPSFIMQTCAGTPQDNSDLFEIIEIPHTNWPGSDYAMFRSQTENSCKQACLDDCYCAAADFGPGDGFCRKKKTPLSNGRSRPDKGEQSFLKVRKANSMPEKTKRKDQSTLILIGSILLGSSGLLNILCLIASRCRREDQVKAETHNAVPASDLQFFAYEELEAATGGFKEEIGSGGFGTVYKGVLPNEGTDVAVKKLDRIEREEENGFETEVRIIGRTNHRNLLQLRGYCNERKQRLLVYEYMSNGSLANYLFGDSRPRWYSRVQIAFGIARGLLYLHEECSTTIIHCDIKPQNILLDESLTAKISDFGLSKFMKIDQTRTTTRIRGTKGYLAPEWFKRLPITVKVDVYSFGIVLLELITCRKSVELEMEAENRIILSDWASDCYRDESVHLLVEEDEEATDDMKRVERFVQIAMWCIQQDPSLRPPMKKVTQMLEGAIPVSAPPDPDSFISSTI